MSIIVILEETKGSDEADKFIAVSLLQIERIRKAIEHLEDAKRRCVVIYPNEQPSIKNENNL